MKYLDKIVEDQIVCAVVQASTFSVCRKVWQKPELSDLEFDYTQGGSSATWEDSSGIMS